MTLWRRNAKLQFLLIFLYDFTFFCMTFSCLVWDDCQLLARNKLGMVRLGLQQSAHRKMILLTAPELVALWAVAGAKAVGIGVYVSNVVCH